MLAEPGKRVVVEDLAPGVGVIAGRIPAIPNVREVRAMVARWDFGHRDVEPVQRFLLERIDIRRNSTRRQCVPGKVEQRRGKDLRHREALIEGLRPFDLVDQRRGHRRASLVVLRIVGQHVGLERPVLVELRRKLDEVAWHVGARERRVMNVGEHPVQRVSELVEHRRHVIISQQSRLARGRLGEIGDVVHDRFPARQRRLVDELIHPCPTLLVVALEVVGIKQRQRLAVGIEDLEGADIRIVNRDVVPLLESQSVQLVGGEEDAVLQNVIELEVRHDLRFIQVILRLPHLLRVVLPIPRLQLETPALRVDQLLHVGRFGAGARRGRRNEIGEELYRVLGGFGPLRRQRVGRPRWIAEQLGFLRAQLGHATDRVPRIVAVAACGAQRRKLEQLLAHRTVGELCLRGLLSSVAERQDPFATQSALLRRGGSGLNLIAGHAGKL